MKLRRLLASIFLIAACRSTTDPAAVSCASRGGCETRAFAARLRPGDDLRRALEELATRNQLHAAYVAACAGSLRIAAIRFADQKEAKKLDGPFEIVALSGTLSAEGCHLHITVSDGEGRTIGGHLSEGSIVYTTAEVVVVELAGARFRREPDPVTGYRELVVD